MNKCSVPGRSDAIRLIAIATFVACLDQLTKIALVSLLSSRHGTSRLDLIDPFLALEYSENRGAAFGLFRGLAPVLGFASIAVIVALLFYYWRHPQPPLWQTVAIGLIAGGAIGNLMDRVSMGYVVDFVSIGPWPNFNFADSAITIGVFLLLWHWLRSDSRSCAVKTAEQES